MLHHDYPEYIAGVASAIQAAPPTELEQLVHLAREGDATAWEELVRRYQGRVKRAAASFGLNSHQVDDVAQETWLRLYRHLGSIREPQALAGWLVTTARRESLRAIGASRRELLLDDDERFDAVEDEEVVGGLIREERRAAVTRAVQKLPVRSRKLMTSLFSDAPPSYAELSAQLGIPLGSIGPTRGRAIQRLRNDIALELV